MKLSTKIREIEPMQAIRFFLADHTAVLQDDQRRTLAWWTAEGTVRINPALSFHHKTRLRDAIVIVAFGGKPEDWVF